MVLNEIYSTINELVPFNTQHINRKLCDNCLFLLEKENAVDLTWFP